MIPELYVKFEDIAQDMLTEDGELMRNSLMVVGRDGRTHELTLSQLDHFLDTLNGTLSMLSDYNPLQFVIYQWQLKELLSNPNWLAVEYSITFDADDNVISIEGQMAHKSTITSHPDYDPDIMAPNKSFSHVITEVGLYGNMALVNCIAKQSEDLAVIQGSFGGSFIYEHKDGKISLSSLIPKGDVKPDDEEESVDEIERHQALVAAVTEENEAVLQKDLEGENEDRS